MAVDKCFAQVREAFKNDEDITNLDIQNLIDDLRALKQDSPPEGFIAEAGRLKSERIKRAETDALMYAATMEKFKLNRGDMVKAKNTRYWLEAKLGGAMEVFDGSSLSVDRYRKSYASQWLGSVKETIDGLGIGDAIHDPKMSRDLRVEMFELTNNRLATTSTTGNDAAFAAAKSLHQIYKDMRNNYVRLGVPLSEVDNYIGRQKYNRDNIMKAGKPQFVQDMIVSLNHEKTFPVGFNDAQKIKRVEEIFDHIVSGDSYDVTKNRSVHYNSGDSVHNIMTKYGEDPSAIEGITSQIMSTARAHSLMEIFGPNIQEGFDKIKAEVFKTSDPSAVGNKFGNADQMFAEQTGKTWSDPNDRLAHGGRLIRNLTSASTLGGTVVSAGLPDIVANTALIHAQTGAGGLKIAKSVMENYLKLAANPEEQKAFMRAAGLMADDLIQSLTDDSGHVRPNMGDGSALVGTMFTWQGMNAHDRVIRTVSAKVVGERLFRSANKEFSELSDVMRYNFERYKIGAKEWDIIRQATFQYGDTHALMPSAILDNAAVDLKGMNKQEVYLKYSAYMGELADLGTLKGDAITKSTLLLGTTEDSFMGQILRMMAQFKASPMQAMRVTRRIAMSNPKFAGRAGGDIASVGTYAAFAMTAGYLTYAAKEFVKGNSLPDPSRVETVAESFNKSGMSGTIGEFVTAPYNMSYRNLIEDIAGPAAGKAAKLAKFGAQALRYDADKGAIQIMAHKSEVAKFAVAQIPMNNVWWVKMATEHLFLDALHEYIKPGHTWKQDARLESRGQQRIFPSLGVPNDRTILGGE